MKKLLAICVIFLGSAFGQSATLVTNPPCVDTNGSIVQGSNNQLRPAGTPMPACDWVKGMLIVSGSTINAVAVDDGLRCHDFCIEKLSEAEVDELSDAQKKLDAAQSEFNARMIEVKSHHGQADGHHDNYMSASCWPYDSVEIRGRYALITYQFQSCISY